MLVIPIASLAFVVLLFGTTIAAPVPPQPGALHHNDDFSGGSGVATALIVLQARARPKATTSLEEAAKALAVSAEINHKAAKALRETGHHEDAVKYENIAKDDDKKAKNPSLVVAMGSAQAARDAARKSSKEARKIVAKQVAAGATPSAGLRHAISAHGTAAKDNHRLKEDLRNGGEETEAVKYENIAKFHEAMVKDPALQLDKYGTAAASEAAARASSKSANARKHDQPAVTRRHKFNPDLFDAAMKHAMKVAGSNHQ